MTEAPNNTLQTVIAEFNHINPEASSAFIFNRFGETIAQNEATTKEQTQSLIANFDSVTAQAQIIGGVEEFTIQGSQGQLNITAINNYFLATVSSRAADQKRLQSFTHVLVPLYIKLLDSTQKPLEPQEEKETAKPQAEEQLENPTQIIEAPPAKLTLEPEVPSEQFPAYPPIKQFMVEKIGGLLAPSDTVRLDAETISKWSTLYKGKPITQVSIETLEGKKITCKLKSVKEEKANQGIIQVPEKILQALQTGKGKLVMVKPVVK
ncbi:MAG: hypothetical protein NWE98_03655 [Candidatus Bathyarchaeota archaeon]|nr:hypothetical protein [Candidatus Bathyarchaeota archaeon]